MRINNVPTRKSILAALLTIVIGMTPNLPITGSDTNPTMLKAVQASATWRGDNEKIKEAFDKLPLYFIESKQGDDGQAVYYVQGKDKSLSFTPQGITVALETAPKMEKESKIGFTANEEGRQESDLETRRWIVQLDFLGANPQAKLSGQQQTPAQISYFTGGKSEWRTGLKTYSSIIYRDLWPEIDLVYSGTATQVKHEFIVRPGGDPRDIKLAWRGASSVKLNKDGQMEIATPISSFTDERPYSYQEQDGKRTEIKSAYELESAEEEVGQVYGFTVGKFDSDQPLIIDPQMIIYCGYIGGGSDEMGMDVAVDGDGYAYVTGVTYSDTSTNPWGQFPATVGPDLTHNGGSRDAFVAKIRIDGSGLVYCGYIGGASGEYGWGIAVDNLGRAYVTGLTFSDQQSFPVKNGPDLTYNGDRDAFIARVNAAGTALEFCGYIGGSDSDNGTDIAVDSNYNAYIVGNTQSTDLPRLIGPDLTYGGGSSDVFVTKVNSTGTITFSGYIGGAETDYGFGIAVDRAGNAYVTGETFSDQQSFPVNTGPDLTFNGGGPNAFVAKVNDSGQQLDYCGYIGGGSSGEGVAVNSQGEAYLCGYTASPPSNFPVVVGPSLNLQGTGDGYVAKLNSNGTGFIYCGYLGGSGDDRATNIALDSLGRAYVTGVTDSTDFPVGGGPDSSYNGGGADAFITCVSTNGVSLIYSTYLGGSGSEYPNGIAVAPASHMELNLYGAPVIIVGRTNSGHRVPPGSDYIPLPVKTGPSLTYSGAGGGLGWGDAFAAKIGSDLSPCPNGCPIKY